MIDLKRLNAGLKLIKHILDTNKNIEQHLGKKIKQQTRRSTPVKK